MTKDKLTNKTGSPLDLALMTLESLTSADDLRWLSAYIIKAKLDQHTEIRGIHYWQYGRTAALESARAALDTLTPDELVTIRIVIELLRKALTPVAGSGRGNVQIKTQKKSYRTYEINEDKELVEVLNDDGSPMMRDYYYPYAYIRMYAAGGDADHGRAKLLSIYADRGSGNTKDKGGQGLGVGGFVANAIEYQLVSKDDVLDAWHAAKAGGAPYSIFIDHCEQLYRDMPAPYLAAAPGEQPADLLTPVDDNALAALDLAADRNKLTELHSVPNQFDQQAEQPVATFEQWAPNRFGKQQPIQDIFAACAAEYRARYGRSWQWGETVELRRGHGYFAGKDTFIQRGKADAIAVMCNYVNSGIDHQADRRDGRTIKTAPAAQVSAPALLLTPEQYDLLALFTFDGGSHLRFNWHIPRQRDLYRPALTVLAKHGLVQAIDKTYYKITDAGRDHLAKQLSPKGSRNAKQTSATESTQAANSPVRSPDLTLNQCQVLNSVALAQADGKSAKFTAREVLPTLGLLVRRGYIKAAGSGQHQYTITDAGRAFLADHLPLFNIDNG